VTVVRCCSAPAGPYGPFGHEPSRSRSQLLSPAAPRKMQVLEMESSMVTTDPPRLLAAVRIRAKMAKNLTEGRSTGDEAVGCGLSDRKFDCLLPTIGL
jgi:hypothetical protein